MLSSMHQTIQVQFKFSCMQCMFTTTRALGHLFCSRPTPLQVDREQLGLLYFRTSRMSMDCLSQVYPVILDYAQNVLVALRMCYRHKHRWADSHGVAHNSTEPTVFAYSIATFCRTFVL